MVTTSQEPTNRGLANDRANDNANDNAKIERRSSRAELADLVVARVAIADDDPDSLDLLIETLRSPTTEVSSASSGAELVALLTEEGPFDLIVTDVSMPWMEGLSVIRSARAGQMRTPVLVVTGLARPDLERSVERLGNARLLRKPIGIADLRRAVDELLLSGR